MTETAAHDSGLGIRHPFSQALYERDGAGGVRVIDGDKAGVFTSRGVWLGGDVFEADPHLCGWVAGPIVANHRVGSREKSAT
jgi:hypothetical protein